MFVDQGLEQEIKGLKRHGALPGITQDDEALDWFLTTAPYLVRLVDKYMQLFPKAQKLETRDSDHYQLSGDISLRSAHNSVRLRSCLITHCQGKPYIVKTLLKSVVSSALVPDNAQKNILQYPQLGQDCYEEFVNNRLLPSSPQSLWDTITLLKLKRFSNWMEKKKIKVGDKAVKLREDRELMGRCLIIAQTRPKLIPKLEEAIGKYEISVIPL